MQTNITSHNEASAPPTDPYRAYLGQLSRHIQEKKARQGIYVGKPLNGYIKMPRYEAHQVDEAKREKIRRIWHLAGVEAWPLRKLLDECHRIGLTSTSGGRMSLNSLHLMLTNPFYAGLIRANSDVIRGNHEPLVSKTLFETVQRNLGERRH